MYSFLRIVKKELMKTYIHPTAEVSAQAAIGPGVKIWHQAQVREGANIGANCIIGKGAYIDFNVSIGANSKLQNGVFVYHGATVEEGVFLGPGVTLTNDRLPRATNPDGSQKTDDDWQEGSILIKRGASIGARAVILPDVMIGEYAMVGAGAVVTRDVPPHGLVYGTPARLHGYVCCCGEVLTERQAADWSCPKCNRHYQFRHTDENMQRTLQVGEEAELLETLFR
jgi:UDP-2-acetamido-3-amino-2,3-dideoxy-glucuronate N-acetyltransferase